MYFFLGLSMSPLFKVSFESIDRARNLRVADGTLSNTASFEDSLDTNLELLDVVQGIENTEDVDAVLLSLLTEVEDGVIGKRRVRNTVGSTKKHLERNVGHQLAHLPQTLPRILVEETHGNIKGSTAPALQSPSIGVGVAGLFGDVEQVDCSHTSGEE